MTRHQKRVTVPVSWPIRRKIHTWVAKTSPGPHSAEGSMPLIMVVRDLLHLADNAREAKMILYEGKVLVDGRIKKDYKLPVGLFDIISIPLLNKSYRMLKDSRGRFYMNPLDEGDVKKLARIEDKTSIKGNKLQLNLFDGTNTLAEGEFKTGDSLILSIPERNIVDRIEFTVGNLAIVLGGKHTGQMGKVKEIQVVRSSRHNRVIITGAEGDFETIPDYVFMIGKEAPAINVEAAR